MSANTTHQVRYGRCVALVKDPKALCCGRIGLSGTVFCGEFSSKECPDSHEHKVVVLEARKATGATSLYFVSRTPTKIKFYMEPILDAEEMEPEEIEELLNPNLLR